MLARFILAAVLLFTLVQPCRADGPKLGITISVDADGVFSPVIKKISVTKVEKDSLADAAGIVVGDEIVQIEGRTVAGSQAKEMQAFMKFGPGETRTLSVKHPDGKQFDAKLTKPKE